MALVHRALGHMRAQGWGRVLAVGSSGVEAPLPMLAASNLGRAALAAYLKTLAGEVAADGVTVKMLLPGRIATDRVAALDAAAAERQGSSRRGGAGRVAGTDPRGPLRRARRVRRRGGVPVQRPVVLRHWQPGPLRRRPARTPLTTHRYDAPLAQPHDKETLMKNAQNLIAGSWTGEPVTERRNPAHPADVVAAAPRSTAQDVSEAVAAATEAQRQWAAQTPVQRGSVLLDAADLLRQRHTEVAEDLVREEGKTRTEAMGKCAAPSTCSASSAPAAGGPPARRCPASPPTPQCSLGPSRSAWSG